jgi:hypothetical protein
MLTCMERGLEFVSLQLKLRPYVPGAVAAVSSAGTTDLQTCHACEHGVCHKPRKLTDVILDLPCSLLAAAFGE